MLRRPSCSVQVRRRLVGVFRQFGMDRLAVRIGIHGRTAVVAVLHRHPVVEHQYVGDPAFAQDALDLVELGREIVADDVVLIEDYAYPAYGVPSEATKDAIRLCARLEGMITDPVYEGKSMQGMIDLVAKGFFPAGSKVLYAHLGGVPAINGYGYAFRNG